MIHLCPDWFAEPDRAERAALWLAAAVEGQGVSTRSEQLARMAMELCALVGQVPSLDDILGRSPRGDYPTPDERVTHTG